MNSQAHPNDVESEVLRPTRRASSEDARSPAVPPQTAASFVPGYEVLEELGRGGMGVVYKARQFRLNRVVALKMILPGGHAGPEERLRFLTEAEVIASIDHPGIVRVFDFGMHNGLPYFSLEYCSGGSLAGRLTDGPMPAREAARLVEQVARAVQAAHDKGIVHRDLKPANVLLQEEDLTQRRKDAKKESEVTEQGEQIPASSSLASLRLCVRSSFTPKIADFGLARRIDLAVGLTQTGAIMGTPAYMAPEQALGRKAGPAADVYALGAILYECLTGRPPFLAATCFEILQRVINDEPVPPRQMNPAVSADLETICLKCLEKEPAARYVSAAELAEDLRRWQAGETITARQASTLERVVKWARRRPTAAALAGTLAVAVLGILVGGVSFGLYKDQQWRTLDQLSKRRDEVQSLRSEGHEAETAGRRALELGKLGEAARHFETARSRWERSLAILEAVAPEDVDLRDRIARPLRRVQQQGQDVSERQDRRLKDEQARHRFQQRFQQLDQDCDDLLFHGLSVVDNEQALNREAILALAPLALKRFGLDPDRPARETVVAFELLRFFGSQQQRRQAALSCCEVFLTWAEACAAGGKADLRRALLLLDHAEELARAQGVPASRALHQRRARCLAELGDAEAAQTERDRADTVRAATGLDHFLLALEHYRQRRQHEALRGCEEALRAQPGFFAPQYLQALCYLQAQRWADANAWFSACLGRRPDFFWPRVLRATARVELRDLEGAEADLALAERQASGDTAFYVVAMNRAGLAVVRQRWREAADHLRRAIGHEPAGAYQAHASLAQVYRELKDHDAALAELKRAIARQPGQPRLYHARAELHLEGGNRTAARRDFEAAIARAAPGCKERWLASAHVYLGDLKHGDGEHQAALKECAAALRAVEGFIPAHRQRARTLLALNRHAEAGRALDACLARGSNDPVVYRVRGLIYDALGEHSRAVEAYGQALHWGRDPQTLSYRGWVYLRTQAVQLALADFEEVLKSNPHHADALCGRGQIRALRGETALALADAEAALKHGKPNSTLLCNVASIHARAALNPGSSRPGSNSRTRADYHETRAAKLLEEAIRLVPAKERQKFWRHQVQKDSGLRSLLARPALMKLAQVYDR